jgi:hypothetical protein
MAFTVSEFRDLIQLLEQHPTWRAELRRWVLTEELLALPQTVRELIELQRHTEERMGQLAGRMDDLARQTVQLTVRMDEQAQRFDRLVIRIDNLTQRMEQLAETQLRMGSDLEQLKGHNLEQRYRERAPAYFSRMPRRVHALSNDELVALLDASVTQGHSLGMRRMKFSRLMLWCTGDAGRTAQRSIWLWRSRGVWDSLTCGVLQSALPSSPGSALLRCQWWRDFGSPLRSRSSPGPRTCGR